MALLLALTAAVASSACADGPREAAYVERLGDDTIAVERFTRTSDRLEGDLVVRSPVTRRAHYVGEIDERGRLTRLEVEWTTPSTNPDGPGPQTASVRIVGDSVVMEFTGSDGSPGTQRVAVEPPVVPAVGRIPFAYGILEQVTRLATEGGGEEMTVRLARPGSRPPSTVTVSRRAGDTLAVGFFGNPMLVAVDGEGRIEGLSGRETTLKVTTESVEPATVDVEGLASDFAARDARGEGLGRASPADTAHATVAGAEIEIRYSQPAKRGREIWGGLVPHGEVWRTGANAATHLTTTRDLVIGEQTLPAGTYTLWSVYSPEGGELIVNEETGQWGTAYDVSRDLFRVPLRRETLSEPVERFTIEVGPAEDGGGRLTLTWDTLCWSVPFEVG